MIERREVVAIPIKRFDVAKSRLNEVLSRATLIAMARDLAAGVIEAGHPREVVVLYDDDDVKDFAEHCGAHSLRVSDAGLNDAVRDGYRELGREFDLIVIAHGDLASPRGLGTYDFGDGVTIVTDSRHSGTNVMALPAGLDFHFAYGVDSAAQHRQEAQRLGQIVHWTTNSPWGLDIDGPEDLVHLHK